MPYLFLLIHFQIVEIRYNIRHKMNNRCRHYFIKMPSVVSNAFGIHDIACIYFNTLSCNFKIPAQNCNIIITTILSYKGQDVKRLHTWSKREQLLQTWQNDYQVMNIYNTGTYFLQVSGYECYFEIYVYAYSIRQCLWHTVVRFSFLDSDLTKLLKI
jgi:hypothetical protein